MLSAVMRPRPQLIAAASLALALAGCGEDADTPSGSSAATPTPTATATAPPADAVTVAGVQIANAENLDAEPIVTVPSGAEPPTELGGSDLVTGKGARVGKTDEVSVRYTGYSWSTGEKFDASWNSGSEPITFPLGVQGVIPGWDEGVPGMRVGGRRLLIIPPELGYGEAGQGPIAPNETLVFVVDAVAAN